MQKSLLLFVFLLMAAAAGAQSMPAEVKKVSDKYACAGCHLMDGRLVGPSWKELAKKKYSAKKMGQLLRKPQPDNWPGYPPMAPLTNITDAEVKVMADWLAKVK